MLISVWLHMSALHACLVPFKSQKRVSDPWELEFQMVVSCHVGAKNKDPLEKQPMLLTSEPSL